MLRRGWARLFRRARNGELGSTTCWDCRSTPTPRWMRTSLAKVGRLSLLPQQPWDPWYTSERRREHDFYWRAYKRVLADKNWDEATIGKLDIATTEVVHRLADPTRPEPYQSKGLVVGYVQSGEDGEFQWRRGQGDRRWVPLGHRSDRHYRDSPEPDSATPRHGIGRSSKHQCRCGRRLRQRRGLAGRELSRTRNRSEQDK